MYVWASLILIKTFIRKTKTHNAAVVAQATLNCKRIWLFFFLRKKTLFDLDNIYF